MWDTIETLLDTHTDTGEATPVDPAAGVSGDDLITGRRVLDRLETHWLDQLAGFDRAGGHAADGAVSTVAWLRHHGRLGHRGAGRLISRARRLRAFPVTAALARTGTLSGGQLDAILANVSARTAALYAQAEADLAPTLVPLSVADVARVMRHWANAAEAEADQHDAADEADRQLVLARLLNDRLTITGHIDDPVAAATVHTAINVARADNPDVPLPQRNADALVDICRFFLDHHDQPATRRQRPHLALVVDTPTRTAETTDGHPIDPTGLETLLCDAAVARVVRAGSIILDYGTTTPTIPTGLWRATALRDRHCRYPGCDRPTSWCDAHHVTRYPHGPTAIDNLVMLCRHHHRLLHTPHWHAKLLPDATLHVTTPTGHTHTSTPRPHGPAPPPRE